MFSWRPDHPGAASHRANIIFIRVDDHRWGWSAEQTYLASGVFSASETVCYAYRTGPMPLLSCLFIEMGVFEIFFRFWYGKRGHLQNVRFLGPVIAVSAGLSGIFILLLRGGTRWFYFYQEGYKLLFHT